ncbi:arsenate-mycothiol transferase ArsC [Kineococcus auxinigenes]|uniref:arsenate-mycothiol transferase ArsC n=1 Tax=unclassified Kineococcus TaxID=2621656 RepID=UPI003D7DDC65
MPAEAPGPPPAEQVDPVAVQATAEVGIDTTGEQPRIFTPEAVQASDAVITTGCADTCPLHPGKRYGDWEPTDPAGQGIEVVRQVRDVIRVRVEALLHVVDHILQPGATGGWPGRCGTVAGPAVRCESRTRSASSPTCSQPSCPLCRVPARRCGVVEAGSPVRSPVETSPGSAALTRPA